MFNLPLTCSEFEVKAAIMAVYKNLTDMSEQGRADMQLPVKISVITEDEIEVNLLDKTYQSGDPYRMAFIDLPNDEIFEFPAEWRVTSLYEDGKPAVLEKSRNDKSNKGGGAAKGGGGSESLGTEKKKKRKQQDRSSPLAEVAPKKYAGDDDDDDSEMSGEEEMPIMMLKKLNRILVRLVLEVHRKPR